MGAAIWNLVEVSRHTALSGGSSAELKPNFTLERIFAPPFRPDRIKFNPLPETCDIVVL
jgi:hypothetical protein